MRSTRTAVRPGNLNQPVSSLPAGTWILALLWVGGGLLDSLSTMVMMRSGYQEGNPAALLFMGTLGVDAYAMIAYLVSVAFFALGAVTGRGLYGATVLATVAALGMVKALVAINNVWIALGHAALPGLG